MSLDEQSTSLPESPAAAPAVSEPSPAPLPSPSEMGPSLSLDQADWDSPGESSSSEAVASATGVESSIGGTAADGAPATPATPAPAASEAAKAQQQQWSIYQAAQQFGVDLSRYKDPTEALGILIQEARQAGQHRQMAEYGQRYLQNAREFEAFLAEQQKQQTAAPPEPQGSKWEAPPLDPDWESMVTTDEEGRLVPLPGAPPTIVQDIKRRQRWENKQLKTFLENPAEFISRFVSPAESQREEIEKSVLARVQQALGGVAQSQQSSSLLEQNADLLFVRNEAGEVIRDPQTGQRYQSADGQQLTQYLQHLTQQGMPEHLQPAVAAQWISMRRAMLGQNTGGQMPATAPAAPAPAPVSPQSNGNPADAAFLRRAAGYTPDAGGTLAPPPPRPGTPPSQNPSADLESRIRNAFRVNGIHDEQFAGF